MDIRLGHLFSRSKTNGDNKDLNKIEIDYKNDKNLRQVETNYGNNEDDIEIETNHEDIKDIVEIETNYDNDEESIFLEIVPCYNPSLPHSRSTHVPDLSMR